MGPYRAPAEMPAEPPVRRRRFPVGMVAGLILLAFVACLPAVLSYLMIALIASAGNC